MDEKRPPGFMVYKDDFREYCNRMGELDLGCLFRALYQYSITGDIDSLDSLLDDKETYAAFRAMAAKIKRDDEEYEKKADKQREKANVRWNHPTASHGIP